MTLRGTPEEIKAMSNGLAEMLGKQAPPPSEALSAEDGEVDGIKYRVYRPKGVTQPLPVGIWTHGGGWMTGDLNSDDALCRIVSEHASSVIVNVDYRLTPEFKLPTQLQDTLTVYKWARQNAVSIGGDPAKFFSIGGSAGGALALALANHIVKDPANRNGIRGIAAVVPVALHWSHVPEEYKSMYKAYDDNKEGTPIIDQESMRLFFESSGARHDDPSIFVALDKENHKNFPPTYLAACERDPLRDDAFVMEAALKKAGVPTKLDFYKALPHYFWIFPGLPEGQQFVANLVTGVKWLISQM